MCPESDKVNRILCNEEVIDEIRRTRKTVINSMLELEKLVKEVMREVMELVRRCSS